MMTKGLGCLFNLPLQIAVDFYTSFIVGMLILLASSLLHTRRKVANVEN